MISIVISIQCKNNKLLTKNEFKQHVRTIRNDSKILKNTMFGETTLTHLINIQGKSALTESIFLNFLLFFTKKKTVLIFVVL